MEAIIAPLETLPVSTMTLIAVSNVFFDIGAVYDHVPVHDATASEEIVRVIRASAKESRDARRANGGVREEPTLTSDGLVLSIAVRNERRGIVIRKRRRVNKRHGEQPPSRPTKRARVSTEHSTSFRNAVSIDMAIGDKIVNFKVTMNGKFQITGARSIKHALSCVLSFWKLIQCATTHRPRLYVPQTDDTTFRFFVVPCMRNTDFSIGFMIDRSKANDMFQQQTDVCTSHFEPSWGSPGVVVRYRLTTDICDMPLPLFRVVDDPYDVCEEPSIVYRDYLATMTPRERARRQHPRNVSLFVFQSGRVNVSGICAPYIAPVYEWAVNLLCEHRNEIELSLEPMRPVVTVV